MAPRGIMRQTDDSVASGLQSLIAKEREYIATLLSIDTQLAQRLRFASAATACPIIGDFLTCIHQLLCFHTIFAHKLQQTADTSATNAENVLEDMLLVTRVVYAQLHVHRPRFKSAIDSQLRRKTDVAAVILREFLQANSLTSQQLVALPLKHLDDVLERADIIVESASLTATCEATKRFLDDAETSANQERLLIELQSQLRGSPLEMELYGRKLMCRCEVSLSSSTPSRDEVVGLELEDEASAAAKPLHVVFCLDDGTVLFIEKSDDAHASASGLCINLKNDAVFLEAVPRSIRGAKLTNSLVLSGPSSSLQVTSSGIQFEAFTACVTTLLEQNESRTQQLKAGRTSEDLDLPSDLTTLLKSPQKPLLVFPCFHDDELPGIFWMKDGAVWRFVELVQFGSWLLVFAISGWQKHRLVHRVDLTSASTTITETKRTDENWGLVVETNEGDSRGVVTLEVVSERRARIDFWYDQVSKAIEAAAAERKKKVEEDKRQAAAEALAKTTTASERDPQAGGFIDARAKKRQRNTKPADQEPTPSTETVESEAPVAPSKGATTATTATKKKRGSKASTSVADAVAAAQDALEGKEVDDPPSSAPTRTTTASSAAKRQRTPPVNTPKQRWVKRKTEDPDDDELEATQPGGGPESGNTTEEPAKEKEPETVSGSIRIILTGIEPTPKTFKKISAIPGAVYEDNIEKATHVIAPKNTLKRTVKLLCGISCCDHILDERWLDESARVHTAVYERQYCLKDAKAEAKWGFDLVKTMYECSKPSRRTLFQGLRFFIPPHKSVLPPVQDLVKIVEQAGGRVATSGAAEQEDVVITSEAAMGTAAIQKLLNRADPTRVYTPELVLSSILQQRLDLDQHRLDPSASSSGSGSRGRNSTGGRR